MSRRLISLIFLVFGLSACRSFDIYLPNQIHRTVHLLTPGVYVVFYKEFDVINEYGPGVEKVREAVRKSESTKDKLVVWEQVAFGAVPKYLDAKGLIPAECAQGVEIIRSGSTEGGGGWAEFRCK